MDMGVRRGLLAVLLGLALPSCGSRTVEGSDDPPARLVKSVATSRPVLLPADARHRDKRSACQACDLD